MNLITFDTIKIVIEQCLMLILLSTIFAILFGVAFIIFWIGVNIFRHIGNTFPNYFSTLKPDEPPKFISIKEATNKLKIKG